MVNPIGGLSSFPTSALATPGAPAPSASRSTGSGSINFQDVLFRSLDQVQQFDLDAQSAIETGLTTGELTQAEILTAVKKADLALRTMLQVRNKVVEAYQEVQQMRM